MPTVLRRENFQELLDVVNHVIDRAEIPPEFSEKLRAGFQASEHLFFTDARGYSWDAERRAKFALRMKERWAAAGAHTPLLRFEWQEDEPRTVTQEEAAAEIGCTAHALKMRLRRNPNGVVLRKRDHHVFFSPSHDAFTFLLHNEGERGGLNVPYKLAYRTKKHF